jgi:excisionase family DNA binding protein
MESEIQERYLNVAKYKKHPSVEAVNSTILTKAEAATYLRCTNRYLERQVRAGRLKALRPSRKFWRVRRSDLDAFLETGSSIAA